MRVTAPLSAVVRFRPACLSRNPAKTRWTIRSTGVSSSGRAAKWMRSSIGNDSTHCLTGTDIQAVAMSAPGKAPDYDAMSDTPAVLRKRDRAAQVEALTNSGVEKYDIPAFLRKQAD